MNRLVSKKELADLLGVAVSAVEFMMKKEQIPYRLIGPNRALRFSFNEVLECLPGKQPTTKYHQLRDEISAMRKLMEGYCKQLERMEQALDALTEEPPPLIKSTQAPVVQDDESEEDESSEEESSEEGSVEDVVARKEAITKMFDDMANDTEAYDGFPKF